MSEVLSVSINAKPGRACGPPQQCNTSDRGTLLIRNIPPHWDHHRALGIFLPQGPRGALFLISEVPLYERSERQRHLSNAARCLTRGRCGFLWNSFAVPCSYATLKTTQGQIDGFFSQLPYKCYLPEVASVGD